MVRKFVEDRWHVRTKDGKKRSTRYGAGKQWRARYHDDEGKEHAKHFALKRDAEQWLDEVTTSVVTGQYVHPRAGDVTWESWTADWVKRQSWADGTVEAAQTALQSVPWVKDGIGGVKRSHVEAWVAAETKRGLAASTIRTRLNYVQMAFRAAVLDKVIPASPAVGVKTPRPRKAGSAMKILTADQVRAVLAEAGEFRGFVEACLFAGLRLGEAAGLQARDVHLEGRSVGVHRQVQGSTIGTTKVVPPKYGSERTVYIPDELAKSLASCANGLAPEAHLFRTPLGRLYNRNSAGEEWRRIRAAVGLSDEVTIHNLRHTFASNLIAAGCDVVTVQRALGHSSASITLNVYSHLWPSAEDKTRAATTAFMTEILNPADSPRTLGKKPQVRE